MQFWTHLSNESLLLHSISLLCVTLLGHCDKAEGEGGGQAVRGGQEGKERASEREKGERRNAMSWKDNDKSGKKHLEEGNKGRLERKITRWKKAEESPVKLKPETVKKEGTAGMRRKKLLNSWQWVKEEEHTQKAHEWPEQGGKRGCWWGGQEGTAVGALHQGCLLRAPAPAKFNGSLISPVSEGSWDLAL